MTYNYDIEENEKKLEENEKKSKEDNVIID